ncbi:helix-turn-helix transcriptional regulator [Marinobacter caseinilyticus]|uniref:helix-turn-helix transcriptional regulator n=1 Tax=Marinobacter caseinilyticus TaxID=2692195 RepID=UPI00140D532F|nr:WYL domain-containing protein [Marinobacter caseinilyticus]
MKKTEWPIRWDLLLRYRLIEIIALWEGRLTTNHICHGFGIGRQQASKDINTYLRELAPDNLVYDRHLKGYVPSPEFAPVVTQGHSEEYLDLLARNDALSQTFETLNIGLPNSTVLRMPRRLAEPSVVRAVVAATRQGKRLDAEYFSLSQPQGMQRIIEPHTLVYSGQRWHVRGWCERYGEYRDFVLSRFRGTPTILNERNRHTIHQDDDWNRNVTIELRPDRRLSTDQQAIIASDYGMDNQRLKLETRAALVRYLLSLAGIRPHCTDPDPLVQQLELVNVDALAPWLNVRTTSREALAESC